MQELVLSIARENGIKLNENSFDLENIEESIYKKEDIKSDNNQELSMSKKAYEKVKEVIDFNDVVETLTDENLIGLLKSSALMPLFLPVASQMPYIIQYLNTLKLSKNIKS